MKWDAFLELAARRSPLHAKSLLELADLVALFIERNEVKDGLRNVDTDGVNSHEGSILDSVKV